MTTTSIATTAPPPTVIAATRRPTSPAPGRVDGHEPEPAFSGWKDTVYLAPGRTVRLAMQFTDYADAESPYMFHCHLLQHEDNGMMGQFVVVEPGQKAGHPHHPA